MEKMNIVEAIRNTLDEQMEKNDDIVVLGEDVGVNGGVFRATDGLQDKYGEERVMDTPLDEAGILGTATGMAINGLRPVAEIQFSGFIPQAFHHIKQHISRMRMRTKGDINIPMVIRAPYGGGIEALEHHSESQEAIYSHIAGLKVVIPSNPSDAKNLLREAIEDPDPVLFMEPKKIYRAFREEVKESKTPLGDANVVKTGEDITIVSWGAMFRETIDAVKEIEEKRDVTVEMIDPRTINPLDQETILESVRKTGRLVVVSEEPRTASMASEISAIVSEEAILSLKSPIKRITGFDIPYPLYQHEDVYMPNKEDIKRRMEESLDF